MSKNLQVVPFRARPEVTLDVVQTVSGLAPIVEAARMYGITADQASIVMFTAHELGLPKTLSLNGLVYVIDTPTGKKVTLSGVAMNALIQQSGILSEMEITDVEDAQGNPAGCKVRMKRADNGMGYTAQFLQADAQRVHDADVAAGRSGLLDKYNWKAYGKDMYFHRALTRCARRVCPDVISGMTIADELGASTDRSGAPLPPVLNGTYTEVVEPQVARTTVVTPAGREVTLSGVSPAPTQSQEVVAPAPVAAPPQTEAPAPVAAPAPPAVEPPPPAQDPVALLLAKPDLNVNDLIVAGFNPTDIMAANNNAIPGTSNECRAALGALTAHEGPADA